MKKFSRGQMVVRSDWWRRQTGKTNDYRLGIVTDVDFNEVDGKIVCYPRVHWVGEVSSRSVHENNLDVVEQLPNMMPTIKASELVADPVGWFDPMYGDYSRVERIGWKPMFVSNQ